MPKFVFCMWNNVYVFYRSWDTRSFGFLWQHSQLLDLGPDGQVAFIGGLLTPKAKQHIGERGGLCQDLLHLPVELLGLPTLQEEVTLQPPTRVGLARQSQELTNTFREPAEVLPIELWQVHNNLRVGNCLGFLGPTPLLAPALPFLLLLFATRSSGSSSSESEADDRVGRSGFEGSLPR